MEYNEEVKDIDVTALFEDPTLEQNNDDVNESLPEEDDVQTKAVSKRINEVKKKTENDTREAIAKELGYNSYSDMMKKREQKIIEDAGFDNEETQQVLEKIIAKRLADDPRMKKLEEFEQKEKDLFVSSQLKEISALTGQNITNLNQLSEDTLKMWERTGNLKQAYLAIQGEELIKNMSKNKNSYDSGLKHLANPSNVSRHNKRCLTESEKDFYRSIVGDISDEELNSMTIDN